MSHTDTTHKEVSIDKPAKRMLQWRIIGTRPYIDTVHAASRDEAIKFLVPPDVSVASVTHVPELPIFAIAQDERGEPGKRIYVMAPDMGAAVSRAMRDGITAYACRKLSDEEAAGVLPDYFHDDCDSPVGGMVINGAKATVNTLSKHDAFLRANKEFGGRVIDHRISGTHSTYTVWLPVRMLNRLGATPSTGLSVRITDTDMILTKRRSADECEKIEVYHYKGKVRATVSRKMIPLAYHNCQVEFILTSDMVLRVRTFI